MIADLDPHRADAHLGDLSPRMRAFNDAGVLASADLHAARELARLTGTADPDVVLAAAFAVRAPRYGHVYADLADLPTVVTGEDGRAVDLDPGVWPDDPEAWTAAVAASPLVAGTDGACPLHLDGSRLYLDRFWRYEHAVAAEVRRRAADDGSGVDLGTTGRAALDRLLGGDAHQRAAAAAALTTRLSVIAGGPGTGKTATVATLIAAALSHGSRSDGGGPVRVAVAAPTGKAAARMGEALREAADAMPADVVDPDLLRAVEPRTLHRLLGWRGARTRFRHDADDPLGVDLVVVDEVSMVSLGLLVRLLEAVPPHANLVLVGDPDQLAAVEAGTVLGDLMAGAGVAGMADRVVTLRTAYRYDEVIGGFADAVRRGDVDDVLSRVQVDPDDPAASRISLVVPDEPGQWPGVDPALAGVRAMVTAAARRTVEAAAAGRAADALASTLAVKVLCAHRRGPEGLQAWNAGVESWVHELPPYRRPEWYAGRPVIVTGNDYDLEVYNGSVGVVVRGDDDRLRVVVDGRDGRPIEHRRLQDVETVHAMTVHKSQGSAFDRVVVVLPSERSPIMTRELLYTAVTRARHAVTIVGTREALADAVGRPVTRASALAERLDG